MGQELVRKINEFLSVDMRARLKRDPKLENVIVWVAAFNAQTGTVSLGLALGEAGCSPFCGCAAHQLADSIGNFLKIQFPEVKRVIGVAALPSDEVLERWRSL